MKILSSSWLAVLMLSSVYVSAGTLYVDLNSVNPVAPYADWSTAATNIQDAVDAANPDDLVLVTNGIYETGLRSSNRVAVTKPIFVQSVNGPQATIIKGYQMPDALWGSNAVRCVLLTNGATLSGFTLTNGASASVPLQGGGGGQPFPYSASNGGGGVRGVSSNSTAVVSNCVLTGNAAWQVGGGAYRVILIDCVLSNNIGGFGGGAYECTLSNCLIVHNFSAPDGSGFGGGTYTSILQRCIVSDNVAAIGGGVAYSSAANCLIVNNTSTNYGGGAAFASLANCTVVSNRAGPLLSGGGIHSCSASNSIIYFNLPFDYVGGGVGNQKYCCTVSVPTYSLNITNNPQFVDAAAGDFRLQASSPCINAGNNFSASGGTDLDGNPRIVGLTADIGAYEFQTPSSVLPFAWAQKYGLATDGSADYQDPDGDGMNNWQESTALTDPNDSGSVLRIVSLQIYPSGGCYFIWSSIPGKYYFVQRSTNLLSQPAFTSIASNIPEFSPMPNTTIFVDTTATNGGPYFYRVGPQ